MEMIVLYSTNCPKCVVLKEKLDEAGISYSQGEIKDLVAAGYRQAPMLFVDDKFMSFGEAVEWIGARA